MLAVGSLAPDIDALDHLGRRFHLAATASSRLCTVIYFFPKAFTPGCTRETQTFRDNYNELSLAGAEVVGVSTDDADTQCRFAESTSVQFPMLGDHDGAITKAYDVLWPIVGLAQRVTYILDPQRLVLSSFHHELRIEKIRDEVLLFVDGLFQSRRPTE